MSYKWFIFRWLWNLNKKCYPMVRLLSAKGFQKVSLTSVLPSDVWLHVHSSGGRGLSNRARQRRRLLRASSERHPGPQGASGGSVQPGAGKDDQTRSADRGTLCGFYVLQLIELLFFLFQSTTPRCSHWKTVSFQLFSEHLWCWMLRLNQFSIFPANRNKGAKTGILKREFCA